MEYNIFFKHKRTSICVSRWNCPPQSFRALSADQGLVYHSMLDRWVHWEGLGNGTGVHYCIFDKVYLPYSTGFDHAKITRLLGALWEKEFISYIVETPSGHSRRTYEESFAVFSSPQAYHQWMKRYHDRTVFNQHYQVPREMLISIGWLKPPPPPVRPQPVVTLPIDPDKTAVCGVYLVKSISGHYKIGKSSNIRDRVRTFGIQLPFEIELEHFIPTMNYHEAERALHRRFAAKRVNGEWFSLTPADVTAIKSIERL